MFRKILVPLDGSALSERAIPLAATLARDSAASIRLLQAVIAPVYAPLPVYMRGNQTVYEHRAAAAAANYLRGIRQQLHDCGVKDVTISTPIADVATAIAAAAHDDCDLIVMSTHGRTGLTRTILGSVADAVVRGSHLPVLLVTDHQQIPQTLDQAISFHRILVPLDGSALAAQALPVAASLAHVVGADLLLLYVMPEGVAPSAITATPHPQAPYQTLIPHDLNRTALSPLPATVDYDIIEASGVPSQAIVAAARKQSCGLIVMCTHGRVGFSRMQLGSVAEDVLKESPVPVLLLRGHEVDSEN
jgi:nucleotide-binding universal stress UspA family protein